MVDAMTTIANQDGYKGLYRGMGISILTVVVYRAAYFGMFDTIKAILYPDLRHAGFYSMYACAQ